MPDTTRSGFCGSSPHTAILTQSTGRRHTALPVSPSPTWTERTAIGPGIVIACATADAAKPAQPAHSPSERSARCFAAMPGAGCRRHWSAISASTQSEKSVTTEGSDARLAKARTRGGSVDERVSASVFDRAYFAQHCHLHLARIVISARSC